MHAAESADATHVRTRAFTVWLLILIAGAVGAWPTASFAKQKQHRAAPTAADREIAALERQQAVLQFQSVDLERRIVYARQAFDDAEQHRAAASAQLSRHLEIEYRHGGVDTLALMLVSRSVDDVVQAAKVRRQLTAYESRIVRELDDAAAVALRERGRADVLTTQLVSVQADLARLAAREQKIADAQVAAAKKAESKRQAKLRAKQAAAQAAAQAASVQNTMLASFSSSAAGAMASLPAAAGLVDPSQVTAEMIDAYLYSKQSPMTGQGMYFLQSAQRWGLDPRLLVAISGAESSFGAITCGNYNGWGWSCPNSPVQFVSWADAIEHISQALRDNYVNEGRTSVVLIQMKYAPAGAANDPTGLNLNWVTNVSKFLIELGGNPNVIASGTASGVSAIGGPDISES